MRKLLMLLALCLFPLYTMAEEVKTAPFGLSWGMSPEEVKQLGITLTEEEPIDYGEEYTATHLPKMLSDIERVSLFFGFNHKLWRIVAVSRSFNDPYGGTVLTRYAEINEALKKKYGEGSQHHNIGDSVYKESKNFILGINLGRTSYYTDYQSENTYVQISIRAPDSLESLYVIIYKNNALEKEFKNDKLSHEKDAL